MKRILISRTDSIGDVVLTLPLAGWLRKYLPESEILFLGRSYTSGVIALSGEVNGIVDWDEIKNLPGKEQAERFRNLNADIIIHVFPVKEIAKLAVRAGIPLRIGTTNRLYHWTTCNRLVPLSRKKSPLHEAQLNIKLVSSITGTKAIPDIDSLPSFYGLKQPPALKSEFHEALEQKRMNVIIHPKSKGSAREWGIANFRSLVNALPPDKYNVIITGTGPEKDMLEKEGFYNLDRPVKDLAGKLSLNDLVSLVNETDALVAGSTGPLHIAAALGRHAIGIYPPIIPMHPGRWAPIGRHAQFLVLGKECDKCRKNADCECIRSIRPEEVLMRLESIHSSGRDFRYT